MTRHPSHSSALTYGILVVAQAQAIQHRCPDLPRFLYSYDITITNTGEAPVRLLSRHWRIIDANGKEHLVDGPGVVGQTPRLQPGQAFRYTSYCHLDTSWGTMEGSYTFSRADGSIFEARIARFYLAGAAEPATA